MGAIYPTFSSIIAGASSVVTFSLFSETSTFFNFFNFTKSNISSLTLTSEEAQQTNIASCDLSCMSVDMSRTKLIAK